MKQVENGTKKGTLLKMEWYIIFSLTNKFRIEFKVENQCGKQKKYIDADTTLYACHNIDQMHKLQVNYGVESCVCTLYVSNMRKC